MTVSRPGAHAAPGPRRDPASIAAAPPGPGVWHPPPTPVSHAWAMPDRLRPLFAHAGSFGTAAARLLSGWRPLVWFWGGVLAVLAAGGAVLQGLGPLPDAPAAGRARGQTATRAPPEAPAPMPVLASPVVPPPDLGGRAEAPPGRPPPGARAGGDAVRDAVREGAGPGAADRAGAPPGGQVLVVLHPPRSDSGRAAAQHLMARAGIDDDRVATEPVADAPARAIIRFYAAADHALARRLGRELAQLGYSWQIENFSVRPPPGRQAVEVWLPER